MRKIAIFLLIIGFYIQDIKCVPANPTIFYLYSKNGERIPLRLIGDEYNKFAIDLNSGLYSAQDSLNCWRFVALDENNKLYFTNFKVTESLQTESTRDVPESLRYDIKSLFKNPRKVAPSHKNSIQNIISGDRKILIVLLQFPDVNFTIPKDEFDALFNQKNYNKGSSIGSVKDYFDEVSGGKLNLSSTIIGPFTTKNKMAYYGKNSGIGGLDANVFEMFKECLDYAKTKVDLSEYDVDGDGFIDNLHIIYSGYGEESGASANTIWAHESSFSPVTIEYGLKIDRYSCSPELRGNNGNKISSIGPPCHEICHALGAEDYYDTDYSTGGKYEGTSIWDLMGSGSWNKDGDIPAWPNSFIRAYNFGWEEPIILTKNGDYDFQINSKYKIFRIDTPEENDFFLLEYHNKEFFHSGEPSSGILIYHLGPDLHSRAKKNVINSTFPQQCYPVCASSSYVTPTKDPTSYGKIAKEECLFSDQFGFTSFSSLTTPAAYTFSGKNAGFTISNIHTGANGIPSFCFTSDISMPEETTTGWIERFENFSVLNNWTQTTINGKATWQLKKILSATTDSYISLFADENVINPIFIDTKIESPLINISSTKKDLHLVLTPKNEWCFNAVIRNCSQKMSDWEFIVSDFEGNIIDNFKIEVPGSLEWQEINKKIILPENHLFKLSLITKMATSTNGHLDIQSLRIGELNPEFSNQVDIPIETDSIYQIFDINGNNLSGINFEDLSNGLYIIKTPSGYSKIYKRNN